MSVLLASCCFPEEALALAVAREVVARRLAACCQVGAAVRSVYEWEGKPEEAVEFPLNCKSTDEAWPALEQFLQSRHPYQVPEIIAVPVTRGLAAYLEWVQANSRPAHTGSS